MLRKVVIIITLAAILATSLTSCHGNRAYEPFEMPDLFDTDREYNITFWAKNDTNNNQVAVYNAAVKAFEELYPNIDVTIKFYTDYGRIYTDVITNMATKTTPNVCITYPDHIATYMTGKNTIVPLGALMSDEK